MHEITDWVREQPELTPWPKWRKDLEGHRKKLGKRLTEQGHGPEHYRGGTGYMRRPGDNRPIKVDKLPPVKRATVGPDHYPEGYDRLQQHGHGFLELPPDWSDRGRGGVNGRNPGLATLTVRNGRGVKLGKYKPGGKGSRLKGKIKPLTAKQVRAAEKKLERKQGKLVPPDKSVHTVALNEGEFDYKLDRLEWRALGYAKRKGVPPSSDDL